MIAVIGFVVGGVLAIAVDLLVTRCRKKARLQEKEGAE